MILRTEALSKTFAVGFRRRRVEAVRDLTLEVREGEIFGFVGPNGAGKTTTIKMLMGLIRPTRGQAFIFDAPIPSKASKARIGYLPEQPAYYEFLSGAEAMRLFAVLAEVPARQQRRRCAELLDLVGLGPAADRPIRKYSKGMQQRLGIAQSLVSDPAFVVLDEPMSGLDPIGRKEMRDIIVELKQRGKTVFFSTHILPDVEAVCDRVGIILEGSLRAVGRIADLLSPAVRSIDVTAVVGPAGDEGWMRGGDLLMRDGERVTMAYRSEAAADDAIRTIVTAGGRILAVARHRENLEEFFLRTLGTGSAANEPPGRLGAAVRDGR